MTGWRFTRRNAISTAAPPGTMDACCRASDRGGAAPARAKSRRVRHPQLRSTAADAADNVTEVTVLPAMFFIAFGSVIVLVLAPGSFR